MADYLVQDNIEESSTTLFKEESAYPSSSFDDRLNATILSGQNSAITRVKIIDTRREVTEPSFFTENYELVSKFKVNKRFKVRVKLVRKELYN